MNVEVHIASPLIGRSGQRSEKSLARDTINGLATETKQAVPPGVTIPPSLRNIFTELSTDIDDFQIPKSGDLTSWAEQGVLLLNTSLSVLHKQSASHMDVWKPFTNEIIKRIAQSRRHLVFMLWGNHAKGYKKLIPTGRHLILESVHPSPLSAKNGWFGNKHFSQANQYLEQKHQEPIDWGL